MEKATEDDIRRAKTESEKQSAADNRASNVKKQYLESELKTLTSQLSVNIEDHREDEQKLRKVSFRLVIYNNNNNNNNQLYALFVHK